MPTPEVLPSPVQERFALYYPSIRIHDVNWLKATLLSFPQVHRIVPSKYFDPEGQELVREYLNTDGARGKLLVDEDAQQEVSTDAQSKLMVHIQDNIASYKKRFSQAAAKRDYDENWNTYRIHDLKFEGSVLSQLLSNKLAWKSNRNDSSWWSFHPTLGKAIMSTIAIAIANSKGLDIVTDDHVAHRSVCTQKTEDVYAELLGTVIPPPPQPAVGVEDELAHLVMTTCFNVENLTIAQIVELQRDGSDLQKFKEKLKTIAGMIPDITDPEERTNRLKTAAEKVLAEWDKHRSSLVKKGFAAIFDATDTKLPEGATAALCIANSAAQDSLFVAGIMAAVGLTAYPGLKMWRKYKESLDSPYNYLTKITKAGATLAVPTSIRPPNPGFLGKLKGLVGRKKG